MPTFDATDLASKYMESILTCLQNEENINAAVLTRGIVIEDPAVKGKNGNNATLATIKDQFGPDGNQLSGSTFTYHEPQRKEAETVRFITKDLSDREKIALASAYFTAGTEAGKKFTGNNEAMKFLDAVQILVADEMRNTKLFTKPLSYEVSNDFTTKLNVLKERAPYVAQMSTANTQFKDQLQQEFYKVSLQKQEFLKRGNTKKPSELKGSNADKYKILSIITAAIDKFNQDYDIKKLSAAVNDAVAQDNQRKKGKLGTHHTSEIIQKVAQIVASEINNRANIKPDATPKPAEASANRASVSSRSGMFAHKPAHHSATTSVKRDISEPSSEPPSPRSKK
jgi:hypothetical protein